MFREQVVGSKFVFGMIITGGGQSEMKNVFVKVKHKLFASLSMLPSLAPSFLHLTPTV